MDKENLRIMGEVWASHAIGCGKTSLPKPVFPTHAVYLGGPPR